MPPHIFFFTLLSFSISLLHFHCPTTVYTLLHLLITPHVPLFTCPSSSPPCPLITLVSVSSPLCPSLHAISLTPPPSISYFPSSSPHHPPCPSLHLPFVFTSMPPRHPRIRLFTLVSFSSCHLPHSTTIYILLPLFTSSSPPCPSLHLPFVFTSMPPRHPRIRLFTFLSFSSCHLPHLHYPTTIFILLHLITPMCLSSSSPPCPLVTLVSISSPSCLSLHAIYLIFITPPPSISYFTSSSPPCASLHLPFIIYTSMPPHHPRIHLFTLLSFFMPSTSSSLPHHHLYPTSPLHLLITPHVPLFTCP
ncbi:leucine-rich repeat extensin-like protein 1 isoform X3 [Rana temporaria]|uniref:leucine-rich repeat extensin-like protein 1 isoform X3 n=1 Tax=Rana temporaria TaxID=8407 RepID=UPI001AACB571|nr:leucine-rich repeat extensin-like protein 1 isoform X3 [Rana temporaria]